MKDFIGVVFIGICMLPLYFSRKKIGYLFCPDDVIPYYTKNRFFVLYNFFPACGILAIQILQLRKLETVNNFIEKHEFVFGFICLLNLLVLLYLFGLVLDKYLMIYNENYKKWKSNKNTR